MRREQCVEKAPLIEEGGCKTAASPRGCTVCSKEGDMSPANTLETSHECRPRWEHVLPPYRRQRIQNLKHHNGFQRARCSDTMTSAASSQDLHQSAFPSYILTCTCARSRQTRRAREREPKSTEYDYSAPHQTRMRTRETVPGTSTDYVCM
ncbi:uncharacterized protein K452DRAFT_102543 [Aplosporella prunicola CBS 121167]|uniref:Uncharacterized protein n=1 Tax=Aplosporella prunicola CBS 121167 TaxID=1176127 RepID=A0A6A6BRE9_9PEZI|nr:uncharacterized protein K452DRAFT_102543 [Aplosporella prunicola CBS 121167]KAF2145875.1 hypothetical protein K452DRAFT_102543 [Aplosporella prunicola CBS 121167]